MKINSMPSKNCALFGFDPIKNQLICLRVVLDSVKKKNCRIAAIDGVTTHMGICGDISLLFQWSYGPLHIKTGLFATRPQDTWDGSGRFAAAATSDPAVTGPSPLTVSADEDELGGEAAAVLLAPWRS